MFIVESDPKTPYSIATTSRFWGEHYFFPWIAPLTVDPCFVMPSFKQGGIKRNNFESLVWLDLELNPGQVYLKIGEHSTH